MIWKRPVSKRRQKQNQSHIHNKLKSKLSMALQLHSLETRERRNPKIDLKYENLNSHFILITGLQDNQIMSNNLLVGQAVASGSQQNIRLHTLHNGH